MTEFDEILAGHFVIDAERVPAHRPVGLPLQLAFAAGDRRLERFARLRVAPADGSRLGVMGEHRRLHDDAGQRMDRQEGRIGRRPLSSRARAA